MQGRFAMGLACVGAVGSRDEGQVWNRTGLQQEVCSRNAGQVCSRETSSRADLQWSWFAAGRFAAGQICGRDAG